MSNKPVVVVGAGIGGLSAALALQVKGVPTVLLEQHDYVGGKAHQTLVADRAIDSGPTVFTMRSVFDQLFESAGTHLEDMVELNHTDILARHYWRNSEPLDLFSDIEKSVAAIEAFASQKDANNYRQFAAKSEAVFTALDQSFMQVSRPNMASMAFNAGIKNLTAIVTSPPFISLWQSLCRTFEDPRLRQLFARYSTYCGSSPYQAPATLMLIAHAERAGVWTIKGGMQSLALALADVFQSHGGDVRLNSCVADIDTKANGNKNVILLDDSVIEASAIVFNGDPNALAAGALGTELTHSVKAKSAPSLSAVTCSAIARIDKPDLSFHNVFFSDHYRDEFDSIFKHNRISEDPTLYVCAQDRSVSETGKQRNSAKSERIFCLMNAPAQAMTQEVMSQAKHKLLNTLTSHSVQFDCNEAVFAYPSDFDTKFPHSKGSLYGQPTHNSLSSFTRQNSRSKVDRVYLAGGSVHPGAGVPMVSLSGQLAAAAVYNDLFRTTQSANR